MNHITDQKIMGKTRGYADSGLSGSLLAGNWFFTSALVILFAVLIFLSVPDGYIFGSHLDWLSQHVNLAETIRDACLEQHTLLPSWLPLGGVSNGYQFSYYGFLRPDVIIGCLFPQVPMLLILTVYMLLLYLAGVLLCFFWLRSEDIRPVLAFAGSVLFMTAGCMYHMHRQVMFVNYLPFLLLAFLCVRKEKTKWLPLCLLMIYLHSFYYAIAALAAVGWYWYQKEGALFWRRSFFRKYVPSAMLSLGMACALLLPTGLVLLEHHRGGNGTSLLELLTPNPAMNNLLFNEYGMGLTFICLYTILAGMGRRAFRRDSILFFLLGAFGIFSYILNGTLYARPKILIPFVPLVILHCVRFFQNESETAKDPRNAYPLWPFLLIFPAVLSWFAGFLWFDQEQFPWIFADVMLLFTFVLLRRFSAPVKSVYKYFPAIQLKQIFAAGLSLLLILTAPVGIYLKTAQKEEWVKISETQAGFTKAQLQNISMDPLYHFDSLINPLESSNELARSDIARSSMYSSVTNQKYSDFYYRTLMTPIRINNRVAMLTSDNPFMLNLLGARYLETTADNIPAGYTAIFQSGGNVIAENPSVLPMAYFTADVLAQEDYDKLDDYGRLDALVRTTVVDTDTSGTERGSSAQNNSAQDSSTQGSSVQDSSTQDSSAQSDISSHTPEAYAMEEYAPELSADALPDGLEIQKTADGYEVNAEQDCAFTVNIDNPAGEDILLLQFQVENQTRKAVQIDINGIRNKLSRASAPYPNENDCFHYQFSSDSGAGISALEISLPKGRYRLTDIQLHVYDSSHFSEKSYTPLTLAENGSGGTVTADSDGYLVTSVPIQKGLRIFVDGKETEVLTVNEAFAGAALEKGVHFVEVRLTPPGKLAGCIASAVFIIIYICYFILAQRQFRRAKRTGGSRCRSI